MEQAQVGCSESAHRVAIFLWLHRLSITEGYLVKNVNTMPVDGG